MLRAAQWLAACALLGVTAGCEREQRELRLDPPLDAALNQVAVMPNRIGGSPPPVDTPLGQPYVGNAYNLSQGKRLFTWFNCKDCHGDGGMGGSGPSLVDGWWNYGPDVVSIFVSIRDGRPNGMPAFADKL